MTYYKFVSWEAQDIEKAKMALVPQALTAADNGNMKPLKELYKKGTLTIEHITHPVYKIGGWAFSLREYCRRYWVKTRYYGICEYYAPNKTAIYNIIGRHNVIECLEV